MAPARSKKRGSDHSTATASTHHKHRLTSSPSTPIQKSPAKRRKIGISAHQKQALIDNLQLEITERARRLRAQYSLQAQGLRSRIEIRINRIPSSLRKMKMEDLLLRCLEQSQKSAVSRKPPVPAKDIPPRTTSLKQGQQNSPVKASGRPQKRLSSDLAGDKENEDYGEYPKKRARAGQAADGAPVRPAQVLSPTSSNSRMNRDRPASPTKSHIGRPGSPLKATGTGLSTSAATSVLSSMVEKSKAARAAGTRKVTTATKAGATSATAAAKGQARRTATQNTSRAPASRPGTRTGRRISATSESSEGSTGTVVRKAGLTKAGALAAAKNTAKSIAGRGAASMASKKAGAKSATSTAATSSTGRVLRKRT